MVKGQAGALTLGPKGLKKTCLHSTQRVQASVFWVVAMRVYRVLGLQGPGFVGSRVCSV